MTRLALIDLATGAVVGEVPTGGWVELPNGARVAPAVDGWKGGGDIAYQKTDVGEAAVEGAPRYAIVAIDAFAAPEGKRQAGAAALTFDVKAGKVIETAPVEDAPLEQPATPGDNIARLCADYGFALNNLKAALDGTKLAASPATAELVAG